MAESAPTAFQEKRRILYGKGQEKRRAAVARRLVTEGRLSESLEYLERTRDRDMLEEVRRAAVAAGDCFALQRASQILATAVDPADWRSCAVRAEADGRYYDAIRALERAGDTERAEALRLERHPDFVPFKPAGK